MSIISVDEQHFWEWTKFFLNERIYRRRSFRKKERMNDNFKRFNEQNQVFEGMKWIFHERWMNEIKKQTECAYLYGYEKLAGFWFRIIEIRLRYSSISNLVLPAAGRWDRRASEENLLWNAHSSNCCFCSGIYFIMHI